MGLDLLLLDLGLLPDWRSRRLWRVKNEVWFRLLVNYWASNTKETKGEHPSRPANALSGLVGVGQFSIEQCPCRSHVPVEQSSNKNEHILRRGGFSRALIRLSRIFRFCNFGPAFHNLHFLHSTDEASAMLVGPSLAIGSSR